MERVACATGAELAPFRTSLDIALKFHPRTPVDGDCWGVFPPLDMDDLKKTRDELIEDLESLRRQIASLEVEMFDGALDLGPVLNPSQRAEERKLLGADVEFHFREVSATAKGINSSAGGVCLEIGTPLQFRLKLPSGEGQVERLAELVWVYGEVGRPSRLGFKFIQ